PETEWMIGKSELAKMKPGACLLNLSRGNVVVIEDLAEALESHLGGAAVDVYPKEPRTNDEPFETPLRNKANVILSPHIGGSTVEAQVAIGQEVSGALIRFLQHGSTTGSVNFPIVDLPPRPGTERIQHVHRNEPGVLGDVNRIVSSHGANVLGQVLATDEAIGYLLMDVEAGKGAGITSDIAELGTTVRARLL
ncbi:MAG: NAD(P)-dependent oxidoreductase, partial [Myxococcota bacterium]